MRRWFLRTLVRLLMLISALGALAGCAGTPTDGVLSRWTAMLRPRLVLAFVDVSGSMPRDRVERDLARLARELRPTDRLVVLGITDATDAHFAPALDTTLPGSALARLEALLGLSTARTRREDVASTEANRRLAEGAWTALSTLHGRARQTAILQAVCAASRLALEHDGPTWAILLTDGLEESELTNLAHRVSSPTHASKLVRLLRSQSACPVAPPYLRVRIVGIRHATQTAALVSWWEAALRTLGVHVRAGDVAPYRLRPLLSQRTRSKGVFSVARRTTCTHQWEALT